MNAYQNRIPRSRFIFIYARIIFSNETHAVCRPVYDERRFKIHKYVIIFRLRFIVFREVNSSMSVIRLSSPEYSGITYAHIRIRVYDEFRVSRNSD